MLFQEPLGPYPSALLTKPLMHPPLPHVCHMTWNSKLQVTQNVGILLVTIVWLSHKAAKGESLNITRSKYLKCIFEHVAASKLHESICVRSSSTKI
jgi:hypothetical protein